MAPETHSNPLPNMLGKQGTRPSASQNDVQFKMPNEPQKVTRLQKFFRKSETKRRRQHQEQYPIDEGNCFSAIFFSWLTPVFFKAWKGSLSKEDLFSCSPYDSAQFNCDRIEALWQKELAVRGPDKASLARVYFKFLAKPTFHSGLFTFLAICFNFISSGILVRLLLEYCQQETSNIGYGLMLAGLMILCQAVNVLLYSYTWYKNIRIGGRARTATVCMVYHKVIRLQSMKGLSIGEIVNLCANDGQRMFDMLLYLPHTLAGPLLTVLVLMYTVYLIGPASLLGTGVFIIFYPLQGVFSKIIAHYRQRAIIKTDHRVRLMSEIINCIKLIKMYAWEDSFASSIQDIRKKEQVFLERSGFFQTLCQSVTTLVPILSTVLTVSLHTFLGNNITAAQAFSYIAVLNSLRFLIIATPLAIKSLTETFVAFKRLKSLLLMDELVEFEDKPDDPKLALSLQDAIFAWNREDATAGLQDPLKEVASSEDQQAEGQEDEGMADKQPEMDPLVDQGAAITKTLFDINLDIQKGELLGICGSIGSGKSSLLQSILGRMVLIKGHVAVDGSFAYVSQQACIMNMSLRENILMGAELDQERYAKAIKACALTDDLHSLPNGDETEIGERGINISGGQKQRVSLARALYSDRDIYLLDDPLSAVDTHVGKHIFSECIDTALREKTVLFVTHQLQYLKRCDRIILMKEGGIVEDGTHNELMANGNEYCNLIKTFHNEDSEDDSGDMDTSNTSSASIEPTVTGLPNRAEINAQSNSKLMETGSVERCSSEGSGEQEEMDGASETPVKVDIINCMEDPTNKNKEGSTVPNIYVSGVEDSASSANSESEVDDDGIIGLDKGTELCTKESGKDRLSCGKEDGDNKLVEKQHWEEDKFISPKSSPASSPIFRKRLFRPNYLGALSADSGSLGGVDSEESIFYTGKLMEEEELGDRGVAMATINSYIQSAGGFLLITGLLVIFAISVGLPVFTNWWLSIWLNSGSGNTTITLGNMTYISPSITDNPQLQFYQLVYVLSAVGFLTLTAFRCFLSAKLTLRASSNLHKKVFQSVVHSPMSFFDTTPVGRILSRFSKDLDELDISLPFISNHFVNNALLILFSLVTLTVVFPHLLLAFAFIFAVFFSLNYFFRHGVREIKKYDNLARSPWFSHIVTTVQSLPTIQAYSKQHEFVQSFHGQLDESTNMLILFYLANRWLAIRFDMITLTLTGCTALLAVLTHGTIPAATAGLAISYANQLIGISQFTMRLSAEISARFTSVERINYYIQNLSEEAPRTIKNTKPSPSWPEKGRITVSNLKMRYRPNLPLVLKGISFEIKAKEKVGIVGRTGSGKSSLGVALYRLVEKAYGSVLIDGIDISKIGLYDLRSKLSIIPQDPVLFIGTIRYNLDPTTQFTDDEIWEALEKTYMKESISGLDQQLQAPVIENGENFSVGERQLLCMARALLRNSKILILDEATAAIDTETDSLIQQTIRQAFTDCTILTIAHRLNTILDSDRIMLLQDGRVLEFDSPTKLLANPASYFTAMMSAMGDHR